MSHSETAPPSAVFHRPDEFDNYWNTLLAELDALPPAAEEEEIPLRSDEHCICYGVRLTSWGPYRIFGYLSVPRAGDGPFPTYYYLPRYQSVVEVVPQGLSVDIRREAVTFCIACRGQRNADRPLIGRFPGMLTDGIEEPARYPLRGWVADCIRGLQYLLARTDVVDRHRIAGVGFNDFALHTAALCEGLCCVTAVPGLFYRSRELLRDDVPYPLAEFVDYARTFPDRATQMHATISLFDLRHFAERITVPALLWAGRRWGLHLPAELQPLAEMFGGKAELRETTGSRSQDGIFQEHWLAEQLGLSAPVLPEHWR